MVLLRASKMRTFFQELSTYTLNGITISVQYGFPVPAALNVRIGNQE